MASKAVFPKYGAVLLLAAGGLGGCGSDTASVARVDAQAVLPPGVAGKERYARHYLLMDVKSSDDTPFFTTSPEFVLPEARRVWVGVLVRPGERFSPGSPGVRVVERAADMPELYHGGCDVVNLVADAATGRTLSSSCNVDMEIQPADERTPVAIPVYQAEGSIWAPASGGGGG